MESNAKRILFLDDDALFLAEMKLLLEEMGYDVAICEKPAESISAIKNFYPDCVVLDMRMPVMSGREFLPWIRRQFPALSIVVCSGVPHLDRSRLAHFGVHSVVQKPFLLDEFLDHIERAIAEPVPEISKKAV